MTHKTKLPVIFRCDRNGEHVTAVFPTLTETVGFMCYEHIGQHSAGSRDWYYTTRPAALAEYADLLRELTAIYDDCDLLVRRRFPART